MWLFNLFALDATCPRCGDRAARRAIWGTVKCPNRQCEHFSRELVEYREEAQRAAELRTAFATGEGRAPRDPRTGDKVYRKIRNVPPTGFDPGGYRIDLSYENWLGERKTFTGDWRTPRRHRKHVSLQVMPTGIRIALAIDRIQNIATVKDRMEHIITLEQALERGPTAQEARMMRYHLRRGTTSARFEELRQKYPDWSPVL